MNSGRTMIRNYHKFLLLGALLVCGVALYGSGLEIGYYGDDFKVVFTPPPSSMFYFFDHANPVSRWYRPIEAAILLNSQRFYGSNTLPLHLAQICLHVLLAFFAFQAMTSIGLSKRSALVASIFMLVCQNNVMAIASNDSI